MPLTKWERKERLGYGAVTKIARRAKRSIGHVSQVLAGDRRDSKVERIAARILGMSEVEAGFPSVDANHSEPAALSA